MIIMTMMMMMMMMIIIIIAWLILTDATSFYKKNNYCKQVFLPWLCHNKIFVSVTPRLHASAYR